MCLMMPLWDCHSCRWWGPYIINQSASVLVISCFYAQSVMSRPMLRMPPRCPHHPLLMTCRPFIIWCIYIKRLSLMSSSSSLHPQPCHHCSSHAPTPNGEYIGRGSKWFIVSSVSNSHDNLSHHMQSYNHARPKYFLITDNRMSSLRDRVTEFKELVQKRNFYPKLPIKITHTYVCVCLCVSNCKCCLVTT